MIFGKNKEQTMRQLQFKFDPLLAESTTMYFSPEVDQNFFDPTILSIVHYIWPSILQNWFGPILQQLFGRSFTKKLLLRWKFVKTVFLVTDHPQPKLTPIGHVHFPYRKSNTWLLIHVWASISLLVRILCCNFLPSTYLGSAKPTRHD